MNLEELLNKHDSILIAPKGYSMYPLIVPERDEVILTRLDDRKLKRGDVVLFRRMEGTLILHRIVKVTDEGYYLTGDNQTELEGPVAREQIKAVLKCIIRKNRHIFVTNPVYIIITKMWLWLLPVRGYIKKAARLVKHR